MDDVPEYIMEAARECCAGFFTGHRELYIEDVARAMAALSERERRTAQGVTWQPIETYHAADKFTKAQHIFLAHAEKRWIRMGRYYPEMKRWYYSGTNERSQWAQVEGDAPTHWQPLPAAPSLSTSAGGGERG